MWKSVFAVSSVGRIARAEAPVDLHDRVFGRLHLVGEQRVAQVRADVEAVDEEDLELLDARLAERSSLASVTSSLHLEEDLARLLVDDVVRRDLADELFEVDRQAIELRVLELLDRRAW